MIFPTAYKVNQVQEELNYNDSSFYQFVFRSSTNKIFLIASISTSIIIWILFKNLYPNANLIFDSYHYLIATQTNTPVYAWPIGYSQFIRLLGYISHSVFFLVTTQYFILEITFLLFFFTIRYFLKPGLLTSILLLILFHFNPIFAYTANLVISDTLFVTLSLLWIVQLFWIIIHPKEWMIYTHAILLLLAFTVRYNALYYPIIALIAFILCNRPLFFKLKGILISSLMIIGFILFTSYKMGTHYGVKQFSPFGGWKLANDALYMYEHVYKYNHDPLPEKFKELDKTVRNYFNNPHDTVNIFTPDVTSGSYYMYIYPSPLMEYMRKINGPDPNPLNFKVFAPMGPLYQEYGTFLIKKYSKEFLFNFVLPNALRYLIPPQEVYTDNVNPFYLRIDDLDSSARKWFGISSTGATKKNIEIRYKIFQNYPIGNTIMHIVFLLSCLSFIILNGFKKAKTNIAYMVFIIMLLFIVDFVFSISASAVVLRYEILILVIETSFTIFLLEFILKMDKQY